MAMELVETIEVGAGGASLITFSNVPQTATDLLVTVSGRSTGASNTHFELFGFTQSWLRLQGDGSSASTTTGASAGTMSGLTIPGTGTTSNTFGNGSIYISNYTSTGNKPFSVDSVGENNSSTAYQAIVAGNITTASAITEVKIATAANSFAENSTVSLYLITAD